ncbi:MAG TPA: hypothetical protein PKC18_16955, partial [Lacipirellulaceae bacterium]|nr:hypothetical protein [Lacipirellulaceae bacterium]
QAQFVTVYRPVTPVVSHFAPAPVVASAPVMTAAPVVHMAASPVVVHSPIVAAPAAPVVTYFRAPVVGVQPVPQVVTRHRPLLGGTVSRVRYSYMPVVF